ncbi:MAG: HAD hydrolase family protein [Deltaproteobacteria bacterium]|nr:HAD hydrolase family protein [Deltaproteobacteria bacterium]
MDVDGVLTDGSLYYGDNGELMKRFSVKDGHGLVMWRLSGGRAGILTARRSQLVEKRAEELKLAPVLQGQRDKRAGFVEALELANLPAEAVCYVGDDTNDLGPLELCGLAVAPADAVKEARAEAHWVTRAPGGKGAVRELVDALLRIQGKYEGVIEMMRHGVVPPVTPRPS